MIFWMLAAIDGHAKNFSIFHLPRGLYRLTPLYDVISEYPLVSASQIDRQRLKMAMAVIIDHGDGHLCYSNINHQQKYHRKTLEITSEGIIPLIDDFLQSGISVRIRVSGRSMIPFLKGDEIVTIRRIHQSPLKKGDVILLVNGEDKTILHRIVRLKKGGDNGLIVQTKGDGLIGLDAPVDVSMVLGCVGSIEVLKSSRYGKQILSSIDLSLFRHRIIASCIARRELIRYYCYRVLRVLGYLPRNFPYRY